MKKVIRLVFSITLLSSLTVTQLPSSGNCQMIYGSLLAKSCAMACCKTNIPMRKCPLLKTVESHDLIASSIPTFEDTLQPLHRVGLIAVVSMPRMAALVAGFVESIQFIFAGPAQAVRAPPSDIHLLAA